MTASAATTVTHAERGTPLAAPRTQSAAPAFARTAMARKRRTHLAAPAFARTATARKRRTLFAFLFAFIVHHSSFINSAFAQQPSIFGTEIPEAVAGRAVSLRFEKLGLEQGLSQTTIYDMMQDRNGFMWFATQDGLNRFDGYEIKVFRNVPFDSTSLHDWWSRGLEEDREGRIWVGSWKVLSVMDPITETFTHYNHDPDNPASLPESQIRRILQDRNGIMWLATEEDGLSRMDPARPGEFIHFRHDSADPNSLNDDYVREIFEDSGGTLWVSTANGFARLIPDIENPANSHFDRFRFGVADAKDGAGHMTYEMYERPEDPGVLWIGYRRGLLRFEMDSGKISSFEVDPGDSDRSPVLGITPDPTNRSVLWLAVYGKGLARFDIRTQEFFLYTEDPNDPDGLTNNRVHSVKTDRSGVIWVAHDNGVDRFNPSSVGFEYVRSDQKNASSLAGHSVFGLTVSKDNTLWIGALNSESNAPELIAIDRATGASRRYQHDDKDPFSLPNALVFGIVEDRLGAIWVASWPGGVSRLHRESGRFYEFKVDPDDPRSLASSDVFNLFQDRAGFVWVSVFRGGLHRWDPKDPDHFQRFFHDPSDPTTLPTNEVSGVAEDQAGFIWVGHTQGMSRLDPLSGKATHYRHDPKDPSSLSGNVIQFMMERRREPGVIWAAANGLDRLDVATGKTKHYTVDDGLPNNSVYHILEDEQGRLWMSTNNGLSRFDPETETFRNYGLEVGLQSLEFNIRAGARAETGEMFFGGINGLNAFFPNELTESSVPPEVRLVDLKIGNETIKRSGAVSISSPIPELDEIKLRYDQKDVTFDFVGFHFEHPEKNTFAYKLEGYNEDWVQSGHSRTAAYTNLSPGEYTFRVKAANAAGVWNEEGASIHVVITPPFWQTWWFRILSLFSIAGLVYGGYRMRVEQIERRARHLEGEVDRRTTELRTSNDQLEQSHTIVQAINQETSFRRLLTTILEESRVIPGVEKATALVHIPEDDRFHVRASSGWDVDAMQNIRLTASEAHRRYVEQADRVAEDIYVAKDVADRAGTEQMAEFGNVASFLVLRIRVDERVVAYLVFDNLTDQDAFDQRDIELLERLRDHITSAFIKTRILDDLQTTLLSLQSTQDRLVQQEKMASLGQLTAGIAHEIKNPLNFVNNFSDVTSEVAAEMAEELEKRKSEMPADLVADFESMIESLTRNAQKIAEHGRRADAIVQNMLEHSKVGEGERTPISLNEMLDEYVTLAVHGLEARTGDFKVEVVREFDEAIGQVDLVPQDMGRVIMNLIGNAFDVLKEHRASVLKPKVTVSTQVVDDQVEIRVTDNGPGIPPKVKARIFEPFFTTKPTGSGTGLGLSMSYDIVTKGHGGTLEVVSEEGAGATFIVRLPA